MPSMTEIAGGQQPEVQPTQTPTTVTNEVVQRMKNEAGGAHLSTALGWVSGVMTAAAADSLNSGNRSGAIISGAIAISSGLSAIFNAKASNRRE